MRARRRDTRRQGGVTAIELLIAVAVLAVLVSLGAPSYRDFQTRMRLASSMSDLGSDLLLARSDSIRRNSRMLVCPRASASATTCATSVTGETWMNGWLVCYDTDADGACDTGSASDPNPVRVRGSPTSPLTLTGPAATVIFFPVGSANGTSTFTMTGGTSASRSTKVAPSGAVTSSKT